MTATLAKSKKEIKCFGWKPGDLIYSEEYDLVGKFISTLNSEMTLDCIDGTGKFYCDWAKTRPATERDVEQMFEI